MTWWFGARRLGMHLHQRPFHVAFEQVDDREILIHHKIHQRVHGKGRTLPQQHGVRFTSRSNVRVRMTGCMTDAQEVAWTDKQVGLSKYDIVPVRRNFGGSHHHENRVPVVLKLGPLMSAQRIFDSRVPGHRGVAVRACNPKYRRGWDRRS